MSGTARRLVALTFDYETWQPIPPGKRIDWEVDVFEPAAKLIAGDIPVTLFAEVGEYFWLEAHEPQIARRMEEQWRDAIRCGHDVQLHLHTAWLPECGTTREDGQWHWEERYAKADAYPGDLDALLQRCVDRLHEILRPVDPAYRVTCFRAGAYQAQPFRRLSAALVRAGIECDSSVYRGGVSAERGYDYSFAYSDGQPYFAGPWDPQLRAAPAETDLVELPVAVVDGRRVMLDGNEGAKLDARLGGRRARAKRPGLARVAGAGYARLEAVRKPLNRLLPGSFGRLISPYGPEPAATHEYTVAIGHTKGDLRVAEVLAAARRLVDRGYEVVTLAELTSIARTDLLDHTRSQSEESSYQVIRESAAVLGDRHNDVQSEYLQNLIPLDRERVLDLGCGAGQWSRRIAETYPWMGVVGVDLGEPFIRAAQERHASERVSFVVGDFSALPFDDGSFDCVYADNSLEHAYDVQATLGETYRVLRAGGVLLAAIPSDARNPGQACDDHTWKTIPDDVRSRLTAIGFVDIVIDEVDVFRTLGAAPFAPSDNRMMYVRAWKRTEAATQLARAREAMAWVYNRIEPETGGTATNDAIGVIGGGVALCAGYAVALKGLLEREGFDARIVEMEATDHPRGRGDDHTDTHVVVQANLDDRVVLLDSMAGTVIPSSLVEVLDHPELATGRSDGDRRYTERGYELYDSAFWYSRVTRSRVYRSAASRWRPNRYRSPVG